MGSPGKQVFLSPELGAGCGLGTACALLSRWPQLAVARGSREAAASTPDPGGLQALLPTSFPPPEAPV